MDGGVELPLIPVHFEYLTGLRQPFLVSARLSGGWDAQGMASDQWSTVPMQPFTAEDGCPAFRATVQLDDSQIGRMFAWGVAVSTVEQPDVWGIPTEVNEATSTERNRIFILRAAGQTERYYLTNCRRLGANRLIVNGQVAIRFAVWAPNARNVELVRSGGGALSEGRPGVFLDRNLRGGYIWNDGRGVTATIPMHPGEDGVWSTNVADAPELASFAVFDHTPYMFRITKDDDTVAYRTDIYSRCQIGSGGTDPAAPNTDWSGLCSDLDGSKSCSVVVDPERVGELFADSVWPETRRLGEDEFWQNEFDPSRPLPRSVEDLVIYELDVGALGADREKAQGTLDDATSLLDYLVDLGTNAVIVQMFGFKAHSGWGYATPYYVPPGFASDRRDQFKFFVRECHRRGISAIFQVEYDHFSFDAERTHWAYDSNVPEHNVYYWYEGRAADYSYANPPLSGGYLKNGSSGWAPRYWEEMVRNMFVSSAAALVSEFHIDGFRVERTPAIHRDNVRHADCHPVPAANRFGQKFLREWSNTIRLIRPNAILIAEDYSGWEAVTHTTESGGLGFDAVVSSSFHQHLIGLITGVARGGNDPLPLDQFATVMSAMTQHHVIFHESQETRTMVEAGGRAPLVGENRLYAEALCRFACGMLLLAPGVPSFFMGAEVGETHRYDGTFQSACHDQRTGPGRMLFRFYQEIIRIRLRHAAFRSSNIEVIYANNSDRIFALRRWTEGEDFIIIASLRSTPFTSGYQIDRIGLSAAEWLEILNSDARVYGGSGISNRSSLRSQQGTLKACIPARGFFILQNQKSLNELDPQPSSASRSITATSPGVSIRSSPASQKIISEATREHECGQLCRRRQRGILSQRLHSK